jgi:hypothetical protein
MLQIPGQTSPAARSRRARSGRRRRRGPRASRPATEVDPRHPERLVGRHPRLVAVVETPDGVLITRQEVVAAPEPPKVVIDSSVLIAAAILGTGSARDLIVAGLRGESALEISPLVLEETERNLARKLLPRAHSSASSEAS